MKNRKPEIKREATPACRQNAVACSQDDLIWRKIPPQEPFWHSHAPNSGLWKRKHSHVEAGQQMYEANGFRSLHNDAVAHSHMNKQAGGGGGSGGRKERRGVWCQPNRVFFCFFLHVLYVNALREAMSGEAGSRPYFWLRRLRVGMLVSEYSSCFPSSAEHQLSFILCCSNGRNHLSDWPRPTHHQDKRAPNPDHDCHFQKEKTSHQKREKMTSKFVFTSMKQQHFFSAAKKTIFF